ncbi:hypothetical protein [Marinibacterium profundimaris]|uniref:PepSY domain-containing protein n=1 Tax=Marinibacterium profundimaris TaxID=1679460 RepID=A0A225NFX2_9RHOB|nr:hypothetical protein [Marinibacterium profundimaris]OWU72276.1 hypothetical protein ATO3_17165 [Marinibacterium profundimaris]
MPFHFPVRLGLAALLSGATALPLHATQAEMPQPVAAIAQALSLNDVTWRSSPGGPTLIGRLPGGEVLEFELEGEDTPRLEEIEATTRDGAPLSGVAALLPAAILQHGLIDDDTMFHEIEFDDGKIEIDGVSGDGRRFEAEFATDGRLLEIEFN